MNKCLFLTPTSLSNTGNFHLCSKQDWQLLFLVDVIPEKEKLKDDLFRVRTITVTILKAWRNPPVE